MTIPQSVANLPRYLRFLMSGCLAAAVNLVSRYLLTPPLGYSLSIVVAYLIGMVVAYVLFRTLVFEKSSRSVASESYRFVIVHIGALAVVWSVSMTLLHVVFPAIGFDWHAEDIAHFIGLSVPAITSYFGHKHYTFRAPAHDGGDVANAAAVASDSPDRQLAGRTA